jgi:hypothetical protein
MSIWFIDNGKVGETDDAKPQVKLFTVTTAGPPKFIYSLAA